MHASTFRFLPRKSHSLFRKLHLSVCAFGFAAALSAQDIDWTNTGTGDWFDTANWNPAQIPGAATVTADIGNGGTAQILGPSPVAPPYAKAWNLRIAYDPGSSGRLVVSGVDASLQIGEGGGITMSIGGLGVGFLEILNGALVEGGTSPSIGSGGVVEGNMGSGTVLVDGAGSRFLGFASIGVGYYGTGTLSVRNGAMAGYYTITPDHDTLGLFDGVYIARNAGSVGVVNIGAAAGEAATGAGFLNMKQVQGGDGDATLQFNHTADAASPYYLTRNSGDPADIGNAGTAGGIATVIEGSTKVINTNGFTILNAVNTYTGGTTVNGGTLQAGAASAFVANTAYVVNGGTLDLNDFALTASSVSGSGGSVDLGSASLTVNASAGGTYAGEIIGSGFVIKEGADSWNLTGANSYSGGTTVNAGTLFVNNTTGSGTGSGAVVVNTGGTLGGNGSIGATVTINDGGHLAAGNSPGNLTVNSLVFSAAANMDFEFGAANSPGNALNDVVTVNGDLTLDGVLNVSVSPGGTFGPGLYRMFNYTGTLTNNGVSIGTAPVAASELYVQTSIDTQVNLINKQGLELNFWDGNNPANYNDGTVTGGSGTWLLSSPNDNWTDVDGSVNVPWENGQFAIFQGAAGTVTVDNTNGAVIMSGAQFAVDGYTIDGDTLTGTGANTIIRVGDGTVAGADYKATINAVLAGNTRITKADLGSLVLTGANTYTGGTTLSAGTLITQNAAALGTGALTLNGGVLLPESALGVSSLNWNGGAISVDLAAGPLLNVTNNFTNGGGVQTFLLEYDAATPIQQSYTLLTYGGVTNFTNADFVAALDYAVPNVAFVANFLVTDTNVQLVLSASARGSLLQNSAPTLIPTFADFFVEGPVTTGTPAESNIIKSVNFTPGSSLQVYNTLTVTDGQITVNGGSATLNGGTIVTPGDFNFSGIGQLITNTVFNVGGLANIVSGGLFVNNTLNAANGLTIFQNALLAGSGVINANVLNAGTVAPGNSPGTLTINGNFTQTSSGILQIELASTSVFDQLIVSGDAALAGTLQVLSFGGFVPQFGQQFDFLQAGSISGEFDTIAVPNPEIFRGRILTDDGVGTLLIAPTSYTLLAQTQNQFNVAQALDSYIPATSGDRETVSIALDLQSAAEYPVAFNAIAPSFYESLANVTLEQTNAQNQLIAQRLSAVRLGSRGFSAVGIEAPLVNDKNGKNVMDAKDGKDILTPTVDNKWGVWVQGNGIFSKVVSVSQVPNYRFNSGGFLLGADYKWSENFTTGVYAGYQGTYAKYDDNSNLRVNSALFGGYATYDNGGFYIDAIVGGGYSNYTAKRAINFSTIDRVARSQPGGGQFTTYLDAGYDWEVKGFTFGPIISGQYTYAGVAPFTENGADSLDLKVSQQNANSIRTNIGGRVAYTWNVTSSITFIPEVRMFWQHEFLNNPRNIASSLDGGSGPGFGYETSAPARDSVFAGAGISARFGDRWDAYVYYNADFGRQDYLSHIVSAGLGWKF